MRRTPMRSKRRPSEGPWRIEVLAVCGLYCRAMDGNGLCEGPLQAAHIWGKGQTGPTVVENGLPLCRKHHQDYDQYRMKLRWGWLGAWHVKWLAEVGYVAWDAAGETYGLGCRRFEPLTPGQLAAREKMMNGAPS